MSKRLVRIFPASIPAALPALRGTEIHVICRDDRTLFGRLMSFSDAALDLRDQRAHPHQILLLEIAEIIYDEVATSRI